MSAEATDDLDRERLGTYLHGRVPGFEQPFEIRRFQGGQSNPTYFLGTTAGNYVLRKKPAGVLLPSAHLVEREYAVMRALDGVIPVPQMCHLCEDENVLGQTFYVMRHVDGRLIADPQLPGTTPTERRAMMREMASVLGRLHLADPAPLIAAGFGRPTGYVARQLARWTKQYAAARIEDNADMDRLIPWLEAHCPTTDETAIVHGDFRNYNLIFAPDCAEIRAVLDWELSTIGHPLADLAYFCLPFHLPADDPRGLRGADPGTIGLPSEDEIKAVYCQAVGRDRLNDWTYFLVFSLFRSAAIRAGVFKRGHDGTAANADAITAGARYRGTAAAGWRLAQTAS